jgi:hypothetical protein
MICPKFEQIYKYLFLTVSNLAWISTIHINVLQVEAIAHTWATALFGRIPAILFTNGIRYPDTSLESHKNSVQIMCYLYGVYYEKKHLLVISLNMNRSSKYRGMPSVSPPDICRNETFDNYPGIKRNMCAIHIC